MFRNIGRKIQNIAKVVFYIGAIFSVLAGLIFLAAMIGEGEIVVGFLVGILIAAIGIFLSWICVLQLYAFGRITENTDEQVRLSEEILKALKNGQKAEG